MSNRYVLIISERGGGFTVSAVNDVLARQNMEVHCVAIGDSNLINYIDSAFLVVIIGGQGDSLVLYEVWHVCSEKNKQVFLYGNSDEISELRMTFNSSLLCTEFVRPVDMEEIAKKAVEIQEREIKKGSRKKILVVDDSGMMLRTVMGWLENDYEVSLANSAASAFRAIDKSKPDLILLDYEMPVCKGPQFMEMLMEEESYADIPVIFLTSRSDAQTVREVMQLKPKGYILKSTPQEQLLKTLKDYFAAQEISA